VFKFDFNPYWVILCVILIYFVGSALKVDHYVFDMFRPLTSLDGKRILEARGQEVRTYEDYEQVIAAEWGNLHRSLEATNSKGNEKIQAIKF